MTMTRIVSVHYFRRVARYHERKIQEALNTANPKILNKYNLPSWARGARVEKAGKFQWAVVVTAHKGH